jgi:hypothetical protein
MGENRTLAVRKSDSRDAFFAQKTHKFTVLKHQRFNLRTLTCHEILGDSESEPKISVFAEFVGQARPVAKFQRLCAHFKHQLRRVHSPNPYFQEQSTA